MTESKCCMVHRGRIQDGQPETTAADPSVDASPSLNFIQSIVSEDLKANNYGGCVATRFPPEPNGYLHIGHAKSICLNFGIAAEFGGACNLRFDDTNPAKEEVEYVEAIKEDVRWLGFDWEERLYYASDYFDQLYDYAVQLIKMGKAYVDDLSLEEIRSHRGTLTKPGKDSPWRNRPVEENLALFEGMRAGQYEDGSRVLRAKINMASPNLNMRDPVLYRIRRAAHHRTGKHWCIYPMYDFAHSLSDSIERITHSICTLEFEDHRPLYDWFQNILQVELKSRQIEFARLNLNYTVMSKRKLLELVRGGYVRGWDDPRMPTICGLRRRGYTPDAIRTFCDRIGVAKRNNIVDVALLEHTLREDLNRRARRVLCVLRPVKLIIDNYPKDGTEELEAVNNPEDASAGTRKIPFSRELYIERDDFMEEPPKKFFRLAPGRTVRLRYAYCITCTGIVKDEQTGEIREIHCQYHPGSLNTTPEGIKVKATIHWLSAAFSKTAEVRLYDRLFSVENPDEVGGGRDFKSNLNPNSLEVVRSCRIEPGLSDACVGDLYQFERLGYFCVDPDSCPGAVVFNRTVTLRDVWAKISARLSG